MGLFHRIIGHRTERKPRVPRQGAADAHEFGQLEFDPTDSDREAISADHSAVYVLIGAEIGEAPTLTDWHGRKLGDEVTMTERPGLHRIVRIQAAYNEPVFGPVWVSLRLVSDLERMGY